MLLSIVIIGLALYGLYRLSRIGSRPAGLPQGPPTEPIFGNIRQLPALFQWNTFNQWGEQYGPVFSFMKGPKPYIVVNDPDAARELFVKLGSITEGRPNLPTEMAVRGGNNYPMSSSPLWKVARRQWHAMLNVSAAKKYLPYQVLESIKLARDILDSPHDFEKHIPRYSNSLSLSMTEGYRVTTSNDPIVAGTLDEFQRFSLYLQKENWSNFFPLVWKLPKFLSRPKKAGWDIYQRYLETNMPRFLKARSSKLPSFYQVIGEAQESLCLNDEQALAMGEVLLLAGTETTATTLRAWLAAMALFPEKQRKAQAEIDRVVGNDRMPGDADGADLVYVRQMLQELYRWATVAPLGITHSASKTFEWRGYTIPKGTGLIHNSMAIHFNEKKYPDPHNFLPERWEGKLETAADNSVGASSELFTFGAGRRVCPGQHLADRSLFLNIANFLWAFDIAQAVDKSGKAKPIVTDESKPGIGRTIPDFEVSITPRSKEKAELLKDAWSKLRDELLDEDEQWKTVPESFAEIVQRAKTRASGAAN